MSLRFLAVGETLAGIRGEKSTYAVRKEHQLPRFGGAPRLRHVERAMVQTDWLESKPAVSAPEVVAAKAIELPVSSTPEASVKESARPKRPWFSLFGLKWFRTNKPKADLVQSELSLEKVQPMRNDLADADLRLVLKRKKREAGTIEPVIARAHAGWSELTARLFEIGKR